MKGKNDRHLKREEMCILRLYQFNIDNYQIGIEDEQLALALKSLSSYKRDIILLVYFFAISLI